MTSTWQTAARSLAADLRAVFGDRLRSVVAYGPHLEGDADAPLTCLALVTSLTTDDLQGCATLATRWERAHVATPLILPESEFRRSLDAFPLEYGEIIRAHDRVFGDDPFADVAICARRSAPGVRDAGQESSRPLARGVHRIRRKAWRGGQPGQGVGAGVHGAATERRTADWRPYQ